MRRSIISVKYFSDVAQYNVSNIIIVLCVYAALLIMR